LNASGTHDVETKTSRIDKNVLQKTEERKKHAMGLLTLGAFSVLSAEVCDTSKVGMRHASHHVYPQ
jgi:hypothetical protein